MSIHILNGRRCCLLSGIDRTGCVTVLTESGYVVRVSVACLTATRGYEEIQNAADAAPQPPYPLNQRPRALS